jgi:NADH-quinone oxidoreductase subunit G
MDALGCAIRIDTRGAKSCASCRAPTTTSTRSGFPTRRATWSTALRTQRLDQPYVRENGQLAPGDLERSLRAIAAKSSGQSQADRRAGRRSRRVEEIFALKDLMTRLGVGNLDCRQDGSALDPKWGRASYLFNATIAGIDAADALLIVGSNPRREAAVLNARIRKRWRAGKFPIGVIGRRPTSPTPMTISAPGRRRSPPSRATFLRRRAAQGRAPDGAVGAGALARPTARRRVARGQSGVDLGAVKDGWNGYCVLHSAASRVGALDLGFVPGEGGLERAADGGVRHARRSCSCSAPTRSTSRPAPSSSTSAPTATAARMRADVVLPGAAYPENRRPTSIPKAGCRWRRARLSRPATRARIGRSCARCPTCWEKPAALRLARRVAPGAVQGHPHLMRIGQIAPGDAADIAKARGARRRADKAPFVSSVADFYFTNPIARCSAVMAECSAIAGGRSAMTAAE